MQQWTGGRNASCLNMHKHNHPSIQTETLRAVVSWLTAAGRPAVA